MYLVPEASAQHTVRLFRLHRYFPGLVQRALDTGGPETEVGAFRWPMPNSASLPSDLPSAGRSLKLRRPPRPRGWSEQLNGTFRLRLPATPKGTNCNIIHRFITSRNEHFLLHKEAWACPGGSSREHREQHTEKIILQLLRGNSLTLREACAVLKEMKSLEEQSWEFHHREVC